MRGNYCADNAASCIAAVYLRGERKADKRGRAVSHTLRISFESIWENSMIEIKNLNKTYDNKNKALKNINIHIEQGEFVFIMGRSGSGKSTLMKILLKEVEPTSGQVIVNDMELGKMPRRYVPKYRKMLGVVFQDFRLLKHMTCLLYTSRCV